MAVLRVTRGLPGAGKTTVARAWVAQAPGERARVNRDELRAMLFDRAGLLSASEEDRVTVAQRAAVEALLRTGTSVVIDDTNLVAAHVRRWQTLAARSGAEFELVEVDTDVETCIARDAARAAAGGRGVGGNVIRALAASVEAADPPPVGHSRIEPPLLEPAPASPPPIGAATLEQAQATIRELLAARRPGTTICPSEAARVLGGDDGFRPLMPLVRDAARVMVGAGELDVTQGGQVVDLDRARGPIRLRRR